MTENRVPSTTSGAADVAERQRGAGAQTVVPPPPAIGTERSGWSSGRITALVIGSILTLVSIGSLGVGAMALGTDLTRRDAAGYVTTGAHSFSTAGSALATVPAELDSPGVGWLYSSVLLGNVRIRVTPVNGDSSVFVGIASSSDVDRYLAGVSHAVISEFWTDRVYDVAGGSPGSAPGAQDFWVASASGAGTQTVNWDPQNGSWSVVVMDPEGRPGIDVVADLGATYQALLGIAIVSLAVGGIFLVVGVLLIVGSIRRSRQARNDLRR
jgi:hypothetical protein